MRCTYASYVYSKTLNRCYFSFNSAVSNTSQFRMDEMFGSTMELKGVVNFCLIIPLSSD